VIIAIVEVLIRLGNDFDLSIAKPSPPRRRSSR